MTQLTRRGGKINVFVSITLCVGKPCWICKADDARFRDKRLSHFSRVSFSIYFSPAVSCSLPREFIPAVCFTFFQELSSLICFFCSLVCSLVSMIFTFHTEFHKYSVLERTGASLSRLASPTLKHSFDTTSTR